MTGILWSELGLFSDRPRVDTIRKSDDVVLSLGKTTGRS